MFINSTELSQFIKNALLEDVGDGDHTSLATIPDNHKGKVKLIVKDTGILAGVEVAKAIVQQVNTNLTFEQFLNDGAKVAHEDVAFQLHGSIHSILVAERLLLNCMQRMSGIATTTFELTQKIAHTKAKLLDTRKTTPGMRFLEKWAVTIGGGVNHRFGLYDMILIKDNHVDFAGGIKNALESTYHYLFKKDLKLKVIIEVRNLSELSQVIEFGKIDRILLDNFDFIALKEAIKLIDGRFITEASGGITPENVVEYAECGVDFISMGALTHSVKSFDLSLKAC